VPPAGNYNIYALAGTSSLIDYDGIVGPDLGAVYPTTTKVGSGNVAVTNTSSSLVEFDFNGVNSTSLKLDGVLQSIPYTTSAITISGAGATSLFGTLLGLGSFLVNPVSGTVDVSYKLFQDSIEILIDETNLVGGSFEDACWPSTTCRWSIRSACLLATATPSSTAPSPPMVFSSPFRNPPPLACSASAWLAWRLPVVARLPDRSLLRAGQNGGASRRFQFCRAIAPNVSGRGFRCPWVAAAISCFSRQRLAVRTPRDSIYSEDHKRASSRRSAQKVVLQTPVRHL
jgi:hypothetical protein